MLALSLVSSVVGAFGQIQQANAQANADQYNARVAQQNAQVARQNAVWATQAGEAQANASELKTRAMVGGIKAAQAAGNIDVNSGSAVDVRSSAESLGELDAINIRSNATREAYGLQVQATGFQNQSTLDNYAASQAKEAGYFGAATTLLGGATKAGTNFLNFQTPNLLTTSGGGYTSGYLAAGGMPPGMS